MCSEFNNKKIQVLKVFPPSPFTTIRGDGRHLTLLAITPLTISPKLKVYIPCTSTSSKSLSNDQSRVRQDIGKEKVGWRKD